MLNKIGQVFTIAGLIISLLVGGTAHEFAHLFSGHTDTVDHHHNDGHASVESEHHHCDFLKHVLPDFLVQPTFRLPAIRGNYAHPLSQWMPSALSLHVITPSSRGPPAFLI